MFRNHRFSRLELLVGREGIGRLRGKHVMVVGLGGVGSHAAEALARASVGKITLVDHDEVCATNVNRQIHAFTDTVGKKKVDLMEDRIRRINPHCVVSPILKHHHPDLGDFIFEEAERLAGAPVDAVLDCIDTVVPKADLLERCVHKGLRVISAMGSASRLDPAKIRVAELHKTRECPLAKMIRIRLKERGITRGVTCVYSTERPLHPEQTVPGTEWQCICPNIQKEFGACVHKRVMLGTVSYLPPIFGLWMVGVLTQEWMAGIDMEERSSPGYLPTYDEFRKMVTAGEGTQAPAAMAVSTETKSVTV